MFIAGMIPFAYKPRCSPPPLISRYPLSALAAAISRSRAGSSTSPNARRGTIGMEGISPAVCRARASEAKNAHGSRDATHTGLDAPDISIILEIWKSRKP